MRLNTLPDFGREITPVSGIDKQTLALKEIL